MTTVCHVVGKLSLVGYTKVTRTDVLKFTKLCAVDQGICQWPK